MNKFRGTRNKCFKMCLLEFEEEIFGVSIEICIDRDCSKKVLSILLHISDSRNFNCEDEKVLLGFFKFGQAILFRETIILQKYGMMSEWHTARNHSF